MCKKLIFLTSFLLVLALVGTNVALGTTIEIRVAAGEDDSEEKVATGAIDLTSSDLEITEEGSPGDNQLIGMRFNNIDVPQGAIINNAYVQFHVDETDDPGDNRPGTKFLRGEAVDNAAGFSSTDSDISSRPTTSAEASWDWPFWLTEHEEGPDQQTSDIAAIIQEIVDRPGWSPGNSLVLIITGSGENTAESFNGEADAAALLYIDFGKEPFLQDGGPDGIVSMEAENFHINTAQGAHTWDLMTDVEGFTGIGFMQALPNQGDNTNDNYLTDAPRLDYEVAFLTTGTHYVWLLGNMIGGSDDSAHVGFDAIETGGGDADRIQTGSVADTWEWSNQRRESLGPAQIDVTSSGVHIVSVWMREDGWKFDKIVLTTNPDYVPEGDGPAESVHGLPVKAFGPIPVNGAIEVEESTLEWGVPEGAVSHTVYLSTDEIIDESDFLSESQLALVFADLAPGATYYWRVDEVQADGTVTDGDVWTFSMLALEAHFPTPEDGATSQPLNAQLSWTAGKVVIMHDLYFGTDEAAIAARDMTTFKGKLMTTSYDPGELAMETTYYWAVDQFTPTGTVAGPVWSFTTLGSIPITDPELLIYYDFELGEGTSALDQSGHSNHGKFMGNPEWATGPFGGAVSIDIATIDYIETAAPLNIVTNTITVSGWVKHDETPAGWSGILTHRGTDPGSFGLQHNGEELRYMWGSDVYWDVSTGLQIPNGEWYFAAITIAPDQAKYYLNGVGADQTFTNVAEHVPTNFDSVIYVGADIGNSTGRIMTSLIDEVRFYNKTLTDVEILKIMGTISDVTAPGDIVQGVPNDGDWPGAETPDLATDDNTSTKYLHFKGETEPTGFQIEPASGPSIVTGLTLTTANDAIERDPISFELSGSNDSIDGPYTLIASGDIVDFAQVDALPRFTMNATPITFENDVAYKYYQVMFPAVRDPGSANSMQIAEVELLGVPSALVAHWTLDDGAGTVALDSSGNGNDGILVGDPQWVAGQVGGALEFDGDGDYVDCGNPAVLDITGDITLMCWIKVAAFSKTWETILSKGDDSYRMSRGPGNGDSIHFGCNGPSGGNLDANTIVTTDTWRHVALVYNGTDKIIYIDGAEDARVASSGNINSSGYNFYIGQNSQQANRFLTGLIDDVRIYNQALSATDISKIASQ